MRTETWSTCRFKKGMEIKSRDKRGKEGGAMSKKGKFDV